METLNACPLCSSKEFKLQSVIKDHFLSKEEFQLCKCQECDLIFTNPRPSEEEISAYYKSADYISHSNKTTNLTGLIYKSVRTYTLRKKYDLLNRFLPLNQGITHLDYGCGTGHFINYTTRKGWSSYGFEPDGDARQASGNKVKSLIYSDIYSISTNQYEIITLFHVLEHVHKIDKVLQLLVKQLKDGGILALALPNHGSFDADHYKAYWAGYDVPRHLYHFNQTSIGQLAKIYGLIIEHTEPMKFDSYYVSMLSEKYKGNSATLLRGLKTGMKSNRAANKTTEFSSNIYILRK